MCSSTLATALSSMSGPMLVVGSIPGPTVSDRTRCANFEAKASYTPSWTRTRFVQTQVCPAFRNFEVSSASTASSRSASSKTRKAAFPPSSSEIFLTVSALCRIRTRPTSVEPVKVSFRTIGFAVNSPPISAADPVRTFRTPLGIPASSPRTARANAE